MSNRQAFRRIAVPLVVAASLGGSLFFDQFDAIPIVSAAPTGSGTISGDGFSGAPRSGVFRDIDADGTWDAGEPGQSGITVSATCVSDDGTEASSFDDTYAPAATTTTTADGSFTLSGANVRGLCRVEFSIPAALQTFLQPGVSATGVASPNSAGSFVQFVDARLNPTVTASVNNPADYTNPTSTPRVAVGRQDTGDSDSIVNPGAATFNTLYTLNYDATGLTGLAQSADIGSVWGIAYQSSSQTLYTSAMLKRHSGVGPAGSDAIYAVGSAVPAAWSTPFTTVDTDGGAIPSNATRGLTTQAAASDDDVVYAQVGKLSWGDLDISEDGTTLYAVNLLTKTVQPINADTKVAGTAITIPDPSCTNGVSRPWALEVNDGLIYVGVVCDASTGVAANLAAFVFAYNPTSATLPLGGVPAGLAPSTWSVNLIEEATPGAAGIQLNYAKGCALGTTDGCLWNPWDDTYTDAEFFRAGFAAVKPQPILSDIEVDDDGSLLLAFADRVGNQFGYRNRRPNSADQTANLEAVIGGDILRAGVPSAAGTFVLENDGAVAQGPRLGGGTITGNTTNNQGPGGGEVYSREDFPAVPHSETSLGALGKVPGRSEHLLGIMDPFDTDSGGIGWFPTSGAPRTTRIELYDSTGSFGFGKGGGLADIEILSELAPVEVGNRVWQDDNGNGIQDPAEPPIAGVTVQMVVGASTYSAVTDASGHYLFSSIARTGATTVPELAASNYRFAAGNDAVTIRIQNATGVGQQASLVGLVASEANDATGNAANVAGSNASDSDGVIAGSTVAVTFTLGALAATNDVNAQAGDSIDREGFNRHIFDFGFVPRVSLGNRVWFDTDNDSTLDAGEQSVGGVAVQLFYDADGNGVIDVGEQSPVAFDTTDGNGLYFFDQFTDSGGAPLSTPRLLTAGNYVVGIAASNFGASAPLVGYLSSGTSISAAGVISESGAPDPDTTSNVDDNGTKQMAGFYAGGVLSAPATVTPGLEPTSEEAGVFDNNDAAIPDSNSNLTVDFGFYTQSVGNLVWIDNGLGGGNDDNGLVDGSEAGLNGVVVRLFSADGLTEILVGADGVLGSVDDGSGGVVTSGGGTYAFRGLPEGSYIARIVAPTGYTSSSDPVNGAVPLAANSDDNGAGTAGGTISSTAFLLDPGNPASGNVVTNADGSTANTRVDFGLVQSYDLTIVKTESSSGPYVAGSPVTFSLVASNLGPGIALDGLTVTDRLPVGLSYDTTPAAGGSQWTCAAAVLQEVTCTWIGLIAGLGNDILASGASLPAITISALVDTPAPTGSLVNYAVVEPSPNQSIPETNLLGTTPDKFEDGNPATGSNNDDSESISLLPLYSLGDLVWVDADRDGQFDAGELPSVGVTVALLNGVGSPAVDALGGPVPPTVTDVNGRYQFDELATGDYQVRFSLPAGYVWTSSNTGGDGLDSDAVAVSAGAATATTNVFTLAATAVVDSDTNPNVRLVTNPTIDAGVVPLLAVGDFVWRDVDHDGVQDSGEAPVPGITVTLLTTGLTPAIDASGTPVAAAVTDSAGRYVFDNLLPGDYVIRFSNLPTGFEFTVQGGGGGSDSNPSATTGVTPVFALSPSSPDVRPVTGSDGVTVASLIDPTIDAGIWNPSVDGLVPPPTTVPTTTVPPTTVPPTTVPPTTVPPTTVPPTTVPLTTVAPTTVIPAVGLPRTGADTAPSMLFGALALLGGGLLVSITRRRRES